MTFAQVVRTHAKYRQSRDLDDDSEAEVRVELLAWLDADESDEPVVPREVRVVLASEDFSQEITTTVLWLNEFHDFDIRCIRLSPYRLADRVLLDVQQVVPLPEASAYTVRVREKENAVRQSTAMGSDWTKFVVQRPDGESEPLPKRWAMLRLVEAMFATGTSMQQIRTILPASKTLCVTGTFVSADDLWTAVQDQLGKSDETRKRWHLEDGIVSGDETWIIHKNWGSKSREQFQELVAIAKPGIAVYEEGQGPSMTPQ